MRLFGKRGIPDLSPQKLLALGAYQMRQILVDYGRRHKAQKRGGDAVRVPLFDVEFAYARDEDSFLALNEALEKLGDLDPRRSLW